MNMMITHVYRVAMCFFAAVAFTTGSWAQDGAAGTKTAQQVAVPAKDPGATGKTQNQQNKKCDDSNAGLCEFGFGVGLALTIDKGGSRVAEADVVNGIVRVKEEDNASAGIMFEAHYFVSTDAMLLGKQHSGYGLFVAVQPGSSGIIDAVAGGVMVGFKRNNNPNSNASWNIGIGIAVYPKAKVLGDGIVENRPLPAGETKVRYKKVARRSIIFLFSTSF